MLRRLNYRDHAIESRMAIPESPTIFLKLPNSVTGPDSDIVLPRISAQPDYEVELAAVIGRGGERQLSGQLEAIYSGLHHSQ